MWEKLGRRKDIEKKKLTGWSQQLPDEGWLNVPVSRANKSVFFFQFSVAGSASGIQ